MAVLERIKTVQFRFQTALLAQHRGQLFRGVPRVGRGELFLYFSETCGQGRLVKDAPQSVSNCEDNAAMRLFKSAS